MIRAKLKRAWQEVVFTVWIWCWFWWPENKPPPTLPERKSPKPRQ